MAFGKFTLWKKWLNTISIPSDPSVFGRRRFSTCTAMLSTEYQHTREPGDRRGSRLAAACIAP